MKKIKPAPPVATEPQLQELEKLARERIAEIKQTDQARGSEVSAGISLAISQQIEPDMRVGAKVGKGAASGHEAVYGTREQKERRWSAIARTCAEVRRAHPDWLKKQVYAEVSDRLGISVRTVRRHK